MPPGLNELPPGLSGLDQQLPPGFDPSKLKFPKKPKDN
jgi:signal recognition particle subunit SRP54